MKKIAGVILLCLPAIGLASTTTGLDKVAINLADGSSLQRGARYFTTYCLSCHSAKHMRFSRIARELNMSEERAKQELVPDGYKFYDSMISAMNVRDAEKWFGVKPPDLSLIARSKGADWLYTYLRGFYIDESRPFGVNNVLYKDVAMPNVFWNLQGEKQAVVKKAEGQEVVDHLKSVRAGTMPEKEFDALVRDLVNFLVYVGEPARLERERIGKYVLLFLLLFILIAYLLKKEYWKDVH